MSGFGPGGASACWVTAFTTLPVACVLDLAHVSFAHPRGVLKRMQISVPAAVWVAFSAAGPSKGRKV